ncbi:MAG: hypothetical protein WCI61_05840 [Chloroflexota bacterium]
MATSTRWLAIVAAVIVIAVGGGIVVTTVVGGERAYAPGTPERTVQDYLHAVSDRDATAAFTFLAPDLLAKCEPKPRESISNRGSNTLRATLDRAVTRDGVADVRVRLTESYNSDGPFSSGENTFTQSFILQQVSGEWRFSEAPWPIYCPQPVAPLR